MTHWPAPPYTDRPAPGSHDAATTGRPRLVLLRRPPGGPAGGASESGGRGPGGDPVESVARWLAGAFPVAAGDRSAVIASWMVATFVHGVAERLSDDLDRLGHRSVQGDGAAPALRRLADRVAQLAPVVRPQSDADGRPAAPPLTPAMLESLRRQLRLETVTLARQLDQVTRDDPDARPAVAALCRAAAWLGALDLRDAAEELCDTDPSRGMSTGRAVGALHHLLRPHVVPPGSGAPRVRVRRTTRHARRHGAVPRVATVSVPRRPPPTGRGA